MDVPTILAMAVPAVCVVAYLSRVPTSAKCEIARGDLHDRIDEHERLKADKTEVNAAVQRLEGRMDRMETTLLTAIRNGTHKK